MKKAFQYLIRWSINLALIAALLLAAVDLEHGIVTTKGDANQVCDSQPITFDAIEGKVRFHIPAIGYLLLR